MSVEITEPLANGAKLPDHPDRTTSLKIVEFLSVHDAIDGKPLKRGMHENERRMLSFGQQMALTHLYLYDIRDGRILHTRPNPVIIDVECESV